MQLVPYNPATACLLVILSVSSLPTLSFTGASGAIRFEISGTGPNTKEVISIHADLVWRAALSANKSATRIRTANSKEFEICTITSYASLLNSQGAIERGDCGDAGSLQRRLTPSTEPDVIDVRVRFTLKPGKNVHSVEDRFDFSPGRRASDTPLSCPLDVVWSQNIKRYGTTLHFPRSCWAVSPPRTPMPNGAMRGNLTQLSCCWIITKLLASWNIWSAPWPRHDPPLQLPPRKTGRTPVFVTNPEL